MDVQPLSCCRMDGSLIVPRYFTEADHPWLRALLEERARYVGRTRREWAARQVEPLSVAAPNARVALARHVLDRISRDSVRSAIAPALLRAALFGAAARLARGQALAAVAAELSISQDEIEGYLFADLPPERVLTPVAPPLGPSELAARANQALISALLRSALVIRVEARGNLRAFVREVKLSGLVCTVAAPTRLPAAVAVRLELSGPLALFRHTAMYGRAVARLVPRLAWCDEFRLEADCRLSGERHAKLVVARGDPIAAGRELEPFDSALEKRFSRDFGRTALDWEITREPEPIPVEGGLIFPDFALQHRRDRARRWLVELVGFWTPEYIERKLRVLRAARLENLVLCMDAERNCAREELPEHARIIRFRRRVDVRDVLAIIER